MSLRELRDRPFDLLREMERRSRAAVTGLGAGGAPADEWVGVAFRIGPDQYLADRQQVREILSVPTAVTRVPGACSWLRGIANVRGHLLPITDLKALLGAGTASKERKARVLVVNHREIPAGLVVDEVLGFRRFLSGEFVGEAPQTVARGEAYVDGAFRRGGETWPVFDLHELVESDQFQKAAE